MYFEYYFIKATEHSSYDDIASSKHSGAGRFLDYKQSLFFLGPSNKTRLTEGARRKRHEKRETTCTATENGLSRSTDFLA